MEAVTVKIHSIIEKTLSASAFIPEIAGGIYM
jgi:hypothetical protein